MNKPNFELRRVDNVIRLFSNGISLLRIGEYDSQTWLPRADGKISRPYTLKPHVDRSGVAFGSAENSYARLEFEGYDPMIYDPVHEIMIQVGIYGR